MTRIDARCTASDWTDDVFTFANARPGYWIALAVVLVWAVLS